MKSLMILALVFCPLLSMAESLREPTPVWRQLKIKRCKDEKNCVGALVKDVPAATVIPLTLAPFKKGDKEGLDAWDRQTVKVDGVQFQTEIHWMEMPEAGPEKYAVYLMLRSGKREGKVRTLNFAMPNDQPETVVTDTPIKTKKGFLRAELIFRPGSGTP